MAGRRARYRPDLRATRSYRLAIPGGWFVVGLEIGDPAAAIRAMVDERLEERADLTPFRNALIDSLEVFAEESRDREALDAALFLDVVEDMVLTATLQTMLVDRAGGADLRTECTRLATTLAAPRPGDTRLPDVQTITLAATPAVRVANAREAVGDDGPGPVVEYVEHWVPVPGRAKTLLVLGETPHLAFASDIATAFDRIAATVAFES